MTKKKKWILGGGIAAVLLLALAAILLLPGLLEDSETQKKGRKAETSLNLLMEALITGQDCREAVLLGADGKPVTVSAGEGLAAMITTKLNYEILSLSTGDKTGTAELRIVAPDVLVLVDQALADMERYDATLFQERMEQLLQGDVKMLEYTVELSLVQVDGDWCVVTNTQFSDAITGGLISRYDELQQKILDAIAGGEAQ